MTRESTSKALAGLAVTAPLTCSGIAFTACAAGTASSASTGGATAAKPDSASEPEPADTAYQITPHSLPDSYTVDEFTAFLTDTVEPRL